MNTTNLRLSSRAYSVTLWKTLGSMRIRSPLSNSSERSIFVMCKRPRRLSFIIRMAEKNMTSMSLWFTCPHFFQPRKLDTTQRKGLFLTATKSWNVSKTSSLSTKVSYALVTTSQASDTAEPALLQKRKWAARLLQSGWHVFWFVILFNVFQMVIQIRQDLLAEFVLDNTHVETVRYVEIGIGGVWKQFRAMGLSSSYFFSVAIDLSPLCASTMVPRITCFVTYPSPFACTEAYRTKIRSRVEMAALEELPAEPLVMVEDWFW